ncbi:MAG: PGF-pre-PGF domain-containing protein, partial [Candidatus Aenigmarchaeota archaeon]|nr:PGF-pre-PGF domain-containing protein [Candidatus Aenigmarchaeota archaeon]
LGLVGTGEGMENRSIGFKVQQKIMVEKSINHNSIELMYHDTDIKEWVGTNTTHIRCDDVNNVCIYKSTPPEISGNYAIVGEKETDYFEAIDTSAPDTPQSEPDNSDVPETSPLTENIEDNQDPADEEEPESTPNLLPWAPFLTAAYLLTLRKDRKKN